MFKSHLMPSGRQVNVDKDLLEKVMEVQFRFTNDKGQPKIVEAGQLQAFDNAALLLTMQLGGFYVWPTYELAEALKSLCPDLNKTIEIGSGNGIMADYLNVIATDSFSQSNKFIPRNKTEERYHQEAMLSFREANIPSVVYGGNVINCEASDAVEKFKPETVFGLYITHKWNPSLADGNSLGVDEESILKKVKRYIVVGNKKTHGSKPIMRLKPQEIILPGLVCRAFSPELNRIFVWDGKA